MTLAKLFTLWHLKGIKCVYHEVYRLNGLSMIHVNVNKDGIDAAQIMYTTDGNLGHGRYNDGARLANATIYFPHSRSVFIKNAKISDLDRYISND